MTNDREKLAREVLAEQSNALALAEEFAAKRDWNGAYHAMRVAYAASLGVDDGVREAVIRECAEKANEAYRRYSEPTGWDHGAQDACIKIERAILAALTPANKQEGE